MSGDKALVCRVVVAGVGGQGSLTMTRLLGEAAIEAGLEAVAGEIHGMSQRGGVVISTLVIGRVKSPLIGRGRADLLVGFEPLETMRAVDRAGEKTTILFNTCGIIPFGLTLRDQPYPDVISRLATLEGKVRRLVALDALGLAREAGNAMAINTVLMGALAVLEVLPFSVELIREFAVERPPSRYREVNATAFEAGMRAIPARR